MSNKKFILNADDFGMSNAFNKAVIDGYHRGILKSASICANGEAFSTAITEILPECPDLGLGIHLNIIEGKSIKLPEEIPLLVNKNGDFKNGYLQMILLSKNQDFLNQVEAEFRAQIDKVLEHKKVTHLDSHVHVHAIPEIFKLTCKLAKEYEIKQIRTQLERPYLTPELGKLLSFKFPVNLIKLALLGFFTLQNKKVAQEYNLTTNDFIIGVSYTSMMDDKTVFYGLKSINEDNVVVEALIHPCNYKEIRNDNHYKEFLITQNLDLKDKIERLGFEITNYKN